MGCEEFVRNRITELRIQKNVSEHRMSLDLNKSGSYIRGITSGVVMPSLKELFNILDYLEITPSTFFAPLEDDGSAYHRLCERMRRMDAGELKKVETFLDWIDPA